MPYNIYNHIAYIVIMQLNFRTSWANRLFLTQYCVQDQYPGAISSCTLISRVFKTLFGSQDFPQVGHGKFELKWRHNPAGQIVNPSGQIVNPAGQIVNPAGQIVNHAGNFFWGWKSCRPNS